MILNRNFIISILFIWVENNHIHFKIFLMDFALPNGVIKITCVPAPFLYFRRGISLFTKIYFFFYLQVKLPCSANMLIYIYLYVVYNLWNNLPTCQMFIKLIVLPVFSLRSNCSFAFPKWYFILHLKFNLFF